MFLRFTLSTSSSESERFFINIKFSAHWKRGLISSNFQSQHLLSTKN